MCYDPYMFRAFIDNNPEVMEGHCEGLALSPEEYGYSNVIAMGVMNGSILAVPESSQIILETASLERHSHMPQWTERHSIEEIEAAAQELLDSNCLITFDISLPD